MEEQSVFLIIFKEILHSLLVSPVSQVVLTLIHYSSAKLPAQLSVGKMNGEKGEHASMCWRLEQRN